MGKMKVKKWVGSKVVLLLIATVVGTSCVAARNEYSEQPEKEQQLLLKISNILLEGVRGGGRVVIDDNNLSCWAGGTGCNPFDAGHRCCDGYSCHSFVCQWCPRKGDSCGFADPCCPGLSCDGTFNGKCS